ncbi:Ribosomal large subunit pseudouridine synthase F [compost metagenome]
MLGVVTKKCVVEQISSNVFKITLVQGLNRQIRRMCEYFGYNVMKLERTRIMNIELKGIPLGEWRELSDSEMRIMNELLKDSSGEAEKPKSNPNPPKKKAPAQQKNNSQQKSRSFSGKPGSKTNSPRGRKSTSRGRK